MPEDNKAYFKTERGERINCRFNPATFEYQLANAWNAHRLPGRSAPDLEFTGSSSGTMSVELMFDTTGEGGPVTSHTNKLVKLMEIDEDLPGFDDDSGNGRPPWVTFHWGDLHSFTAIVETLSVSFTYFSSEGVPLRAKVNAKLKQFKATNSWARQNPTSGTPLPHRTHQVQSGETLDRIAARHYGDSTQWRRIAVANGIHDPLAVRPGTLLAIPKLRD